MLTTLYGVDIEIVDIQDTKTCLPSNKHNKKDDELWVQTWDHFKTIDNKTGVKLDMPIHRIYRMTKDNKIQLMLIYDNDLPWAERRRSFAPRTNGTIYNNPCSSILITRLLLLKYNDNTQQFMV